MAAGREEVAVDAGRGEDAGLLAVESLTNDEWFFGIGFGSSFFAVDKGDVFEPVATVGVFSPSEYFVEVFFAEDDAVIAQLEEEFFVAWCAVEFAEFVEDGAGELELVFGEPVFEDFFAAFLQFAVITS